MESSDDSQVNRSFHEINKENSEMSTDWDPEFVRDDENLVDALETATNINDECLEGNKIVNSGENCGNLIDDDISGGRLNNQTTDNDAEKERVAKGLRNLTQPINVGDRDESKIKYSREELKALSHENVVKQNNLWKSIYTGLEVAVAREYNNLSSSKNQRKTQPGKKGAFGIPRDEESKSECNIESAAENPNFLSSAGGEYFIGEDTSTVVEEEYSEEDESDEEYHSILKPAFVVKGKPNFDSGPPKDGFEYLRRVRWEAAQIPKVKVAKMNKSENEMEQSAYMPQIPEIAKCPQHLLPSREWEDAFLADFSELRVTLSRLESSIIEVPSKMQHVMFTAEDKISYHHLPVYLNTEMFNNSNKDDFHSPGQQTYTDSECNASDIPIQNTNPKPWVCNIPEELPTLSAILKMESVARVSMLRKRISSVEALSSLKINDYVWLFSLCAVIDTPLNADTCASLRSLLRQCASLRAAKSEVDDEVVMANLLATIAGRYFGQLETQVYANST